MAKNVLFQGSPVIKVIRQINSSAMLATQLELCFWVRVNGWHWAKPLQTLLPHHVAATDADDTRRWLWGRLFTSWEDVSHSFRIELENWGSSPAEMLREKDVNPNCTGRASEWHHPSLRSRSSLSRMQLFNILTVSFNHSVSSVSSCKTLGIFTCYLTKRRIFLRPFN